LAPNSHPKSCVGSALWNEERGWCIDSTDPRHICTKLQQFFSGGCVDLTCYEGRTLDTSGGPGKAKCSPCAVGRDAGLYHNENLYYSCNTCKNKRTYSFDPSSETGKCRSVVCDGGTPNTNTDTCDCPSGFKYTETYSLDTLTYKCVDPRCTKDTQFFYGNLCYDLTCRNGGEVDPSGGIGKATCLCPSGYTATNMRHISNIQEAYITCHNCTSSQYVNPFNGKCYDKICKDGLTLDTSRGPGLARCLGDCPPDKVRKDKLTEDEWTYYCKQFASCDSGFTYNPETNKCEQLSEQQ